MEAYIPLHSELSQENFSQMIRAVNNNDCDYVKKELQANPDFILCTNFNGDSLLHIAVMNHCLTLSVILASCEPALLLQVNKDGNTPVHLAFALRMKDFIQKFIEISKEYTPPMIIDIFQSSLSKVNSFGQTPLHVMIDNRSINTPYICRKRNIDSIIELLTSHEMCLSQLDGENNTILHTAVLQQDVQSLTEILRCVKSCLWLQNKDGNTPLHLAIREKNPTIITEMLKAIKPYHIALQNNKGETPLHEAALICDKVCTLAIVQLVQRLEVFEIKDNGGKTALEHLNALKMACGKSRKNTIKKIIKEINNKMDVIKEQPETNATYVTYESVSEQKDYTKVDQICVTY